MDSKRLARIEIKDADKGEVSAVFATFNTIDHDKDVTLPGAFEDGASVPISAYGHGTTLYGLPPVGVGKLRSTSKEAVMDGRFFLDQQAGLDTFVAVKNLAGAGLGEWSYGYEALDYSFGEFDGQKVRFLAKQKVTEVSPVLQGSGIGTRTRSAKADASPGEIAAKSIRPHSSEVTDRPWDPDGMVAGIKGGATVSDLRSVFAWVDGDPETKSSYRYPHHHGIGGPANLKAIMGGIVALGRDETLSEPERKAIWEHLASHMRDADREPLKLRSSGGEPQLIEQLLEGTAVLRAMKESATRVDALRAARGKTLSQVNLDVLDWIIEDLTETQDALAALRRSPSEDLAREFARFVQSQGVHSL